MGFADDPLIPLIDRASSNVLNTAAHTQRLTEGGDR